MVLPMYYCPKCRQIYIKEKSCRKCSKNKLKKITEINAPFFTISAADKHKLITEKLKNEKITFIEQIFEQSDLSKNNAFQSSEKRILIPFSAFPKVLGILNSLEPDNNVGVP